MVNNKARPGDPVSRESGVAPVAERRRVRLEAVAEVRRDLVALRMDLAALERGLALADHRFTARLDTASGEQQELRNEIARLGERLDGLWELSGRIAEGESKWLALDREHDSHQQALSSLRVQVTDLASRHQSLSESLSQRAQTAAKRMRRLQGRFKSRFQGLDDLAEGGPYRATLDRLAAELETLRNNRASTLDDQGRQIARLAADLGDRDQRLDPHDQALDRIHRDYQGLAADGPPRQDPLLSTPAGPSAGSLALDHQIEQRLAEAATNQGQPLEQAMTWLTEKIHALELELAESRQGRAQVQGELQALDRARASQESSEQRLTGRFEELADRQQHQQTRLEATSDRVQSLEQELARAIFTQDRAQTALADQASLSDEVRTLAARWSDLDAAERRTHQRLDELAASHARQGTGLDAALDRMRILEQESARATLAQERVQSALGEATRMQGILDARRTDRDAADQRIEQRLAEFIASQGRQDLRFDQALIAVTEKLGTLEQELNRVLLSQERAQTQAAEHHRALNDLSPLSGKLAGIEGAQRQIERQGDTRGQQLIELERGAASLLGRQQQLEQDLAQVKADYDRAQTAKSAPVAPGVLALAGIGGAIVLALTVGMVLGWGMIEDRRQTDRATLMSQLHRLEHQVADQPPTAPAVPIRADPQPSDPPTVTSAQAAPDGQAAWAGLVEQQQLIGETLAKVGATLDQIRHRLVATAPPPTTEPTMAPSVPQPAIVPKPAVANPPASWKGAQRAGWFSIQLSGGRERAALLASARRLALPGDNATLATTHAGGPWFVLLHGTYSSRRQATNALRDLTARYPLEGAWIRRLTPVGTITPFP